MVLLVSFCRKPPDFLGISRKSPTEKLQPRNASAKDIKLWWPIGMGDQPLYDLSVTFEPNNTPSASVTAHRKVGFRYFALVTGNDTDPAYVTKAASEQGTDSHGMYFRINGAAFWSKGGISWEVLVEGCLRLEKILEFS
jgi:hypothetical protein